MCIRDRVKHALGAAKPFRKTQIHGTARRAYGSVCGLLRLSPLENHRYAVHERNGVVTVKHGVVTVKSRYAQCS